MNAYGCLTKWERVFAVWASVVWCALARPALCEPAIEWEELKGKHFIILYEDDSDREFAKTMLRRAEDYYRKIGRDLGFTRFDQFWTWDDRVRIVVFKDQQSYVQTTGQPEWSTGYADRHSQAFRNRTIVTYQQDRDFFDGLLPHEIAHLIIHDFIEPNPIPIWFDEGVAQLYEANKAGQADRIMRALIGRDTYIPMKVLHGWDIREETDEGKVTIFYAQSLSVVRFMLKIYGTSAFQNLCRNLRDGKPFEDAMRNAYSTRIDTFADLEAKWIKFLKQ